MMGSAGRSLRSHRNTCRLSPSPRGRSSSERENSALVSNAIDILVLSFAPPRDGAAKSQASSTARKRGNTGRRTVKNFAQFLLAMIGYFLYCDDLFLKGPIAGVTLPSPRASSSDLQENN